MTKSSSWLLLPALVLLLLFLRTSRLHGRFEDQSRHYIDFRLSGHAFTNRDAGAGETEITYDRTGDRVTLHELDGNPTLRLAADGTLCCGADGPFHRSR